MNVGPAGVEANQDSAFVGGVARDGQRVVFVSTATNLVAGSTNGVQDVFLRDVAANATVRLSANAGGTQANLACGAPTLSADGLWSAFSSRATNLVPGDTNGLEDVFLKHVADGAVVLASVDSFGAAGNGSSRMPSLSADGRYVAFASLASNLVPGDTNAAWDVFVHNRITGATVRASVDSLGVEGNAESSAPALAGCGCCVAFTSSASNLVTVDTNFSTDVFVPRPRERHDNLRIARPRRASGLSRRPTCILSADASLVGFDSASNDLVAGDTNLANDVFVLERWNGTLTRASRRRRG